MSLEQNLQWEQEEGPGTFLSLSAQAPSSSSSSSPFRALAAAETSPREAVKLEQGDLETCLSLQQPSRRAIGQQTVACLQEPQPSWGEHHTFAYLQKPQPGQTLGKQTVPYLEGPRDEQKIAAFLEQQMTLFPAEQPEPSDHQKPSSPEYDKPASSQVPSEQQKPASLKGLLEHQKAASLKGPLDQQKPPTCIGLLKQQKPLSFLGLSEKPKPASPQGHLEQQKAVASLGFPSSVQGISEQQKVGFPLQPNPVSLQGQQKQRSLPVFSEQQNSSPEQEKPLSLQGSAQEHKVASPHKPLVSSLQPDQQKDASFPGHLFQGPPDDQKVVFSPKQPPKQQKLAFSQAPPDQSKFASAQGSSEQHKSVVMQAHSLQRPLDQQKSSSQQKPESMQGYPEQLVFPLQGTLEQQKVFRGHSLQPQQGFIFQPASSVLPGKAGVPFSEPIVVSNLLRQNGLPKEKEHPLPMQSPSRCLASPQGAEQVYPAPMATHNAVLADQRLFLETLKSLHAALGVQMSFPKIGESDLDLCKLYKEVTCRGGLEVVIRDGKWKEVALALNFPPSVTTASCILRSSYISVLHHYEQVYFFGACGRIIPPPAAYATESPAISEQEDVSMFSQGIAELGSGQHITNGIIDSAQALGVDPASSVGAMVTGAIDGKFDNGYLVTVMVGARKMRGVLYHVASTNALPQNACVPGMMQIVGSELKSADLVPTVSRKRKKTEIFRKDPNAPRQNRTGYNFFFAEQRAKLKTMQPDKDRVISKMIGELWNKLSQDEKTPYQAQGVKDKERYVREMREYKEKIKPPLIALNNSKAVPPCLPSTYMSEASNVSKAVPQLLLISEVSNDMPPRLPLTCISEASNHSKAVLPQLPFTYVSEALNVSQAVPLLMGNATSTPEQEPTVDTMSNASLVVNAPNDAIVVDTPKASTVVDTSVASPVADRSSASTDGKSPKNQVELPQSDTISIHYLAGSEAYAEREGHTSLMEQ